jgi:hypothetical protein
VAVSTLIQSIGYANSSTGGLIKIGAGIDVNNGIISVNSSSNAAQAYSNAISYTDTAVATAYANAIAYTNAAISSVTSNTGNFQFVNDTMSLNNSDNMYIENPNNAIFIDGLWLAQLTATQNSAPGGGSGNSQSYSWVYQEPSTNTYQGYAEAGWYVQRLDSVNGHNENAVLYLNPNNTLYARGSNNSGSVPLTLDVSGTGQFIFTTNGNFTSPNSVNTYAISSVYASVAQINGTNPGGELAIQTAGIHNFKFTTNGYLQFPDGSNQATAFTGDANTLGGFAKANYDFWITSNASAAYTNAIAYVNAQSYVNSSQLSSNLSNYVSVSSIGGLSANSASYISGNTATDLRNYSDTVAAIAYTNSVSYANTKAATAYSNAIAYSGNASAAYSNAIAYSGNSAQAYANAITYIDTKISGLVNSAPAALDTLLELAEALGNDAHFSTTMLNAVANAYSNAIAYSGNAAQAYANAIAYSGNAAQAYANAIAYSGNAAQAYANAVTYVGAQSFVNTSQLSSNLSNYVTATNLTNNLANYVTSTNLTNNLASYALTSSLSAYQTTAGLSDNVATLTANNTSFVGTVSAANVVSNAQLIANLANYALTSSLSAYQTTAGLAGNVATLTANNTSFVGTVSAANVVSNAQLSANLSNYVTTASLTNSITIGNTAATLTLVGTLAAPNTSTTASSVGYLGIPQNGQSTAYGVAITDSGKHIYMTSSNTVTIPANANVAFPIGTTVTFVSGPSVTTSIAITSDTMYLAANGATGTRTLAQYGMATAVKVANTTWYINGSGLT